ncbi:tetratricopeptide repeat protein [Hyalangium sp.]|uniref:tetratricopeptide repeat protein n=1 Tax=Hyalangium sp. TaxID=2028555 RepID=UPI002D54B749|nr:tetratricopeptide repeat protein [Hyalangium sp.]HYH99352.1 tetratricopeptide repeat protein [Hyalangium sp.]
MKLRPGLFLLLSLLLVSGSAWAQKAGIERYEEGDFEAAARLFEQELAAPQLPPASQALARVYLAASLYALGREEEALKALEVLAREHPEQRVDPVRFPPDLVVLAETLRQKVESERQLATQEAALQEARAEERRRAALAVPSHLRPEVLGLFDAVDRQGSLGAGLAFHRKSLEGSVRVLLGAPPVFHVQGGVRPGDGVLRPFLGLRASLLPGIDTYGAGPVLGGRLALPAGLVGVVDVGADYFFISRADRHRFAVTVQAGLGFDLHLP